MLENNPKIADLKYQNAVQKLSESRGISIEESRQQIMNMSFSEYIKFIAEATADLTPPSGMKVGGSQQQAAQPNQPAQNAPSKAQVMWKGKGAPVEKGMTVGLKGPNKLPVPGEISQVDQGANGVRVKNPTTNQDEWHNIDELEPYVGGATTPGATPNAAGLQQPGMSEELSRLKKLAGISEDASGGASCAGGMGASTAQPLGKMQKRYPVDEDSMDEYTPKFAKTVAGDTKPNQATGRLSARLAKAGKPSATRTNNGFKK